MNRSLKNTAAVLFATALTACAIFAGVTLAETAVGGVGNSVAATPTGFYTAASTVSQSSGTLVCPRTGCTASTCHAVTGMPPGQ